MSKAFPGYKTVYVSEVTWKLLHAIRYKLFMEKGEKVTMDKAIRYLVKEAGIEWKEAGEAVLIKGVHY